MRSRQDIWFFVLVSACVLFLISLPYLIAIKNAGNDFVFAGFLLNPLDGNSYLAKMYQGWEGSWQFHLPYTPEEGPGSYLFLFYILLGHIARLLNLPTLLVFHLTRLICVGFLLWALWLFFSSSLTSTFSRRLAFLLAVLGSGLGWIGGMLGLFTSDMWVAEAFPFLAMYANPHFPLGLTLLLILLTPQPDQSEMPGLGHQILWAVLAFTLAIVLPFGLVVVEVVLLVLASWGSLKARSQARQLPAEAKPKWISPFLSSTTWRNLFWVTIGGVPVLFYDLCVAYRDPLLSAWNTQNLTPSPPWWDLVISFGVLLVLGIPGVVSILKNNKPTARVLIAWVVVSLALIVLPVGLQRRFMLGMLIPLAGLAAIGIEYLAGELTRRRILLSGLVLILLFPTNFIVLLSGLYGVNSHDSQLYISKDEASAMSWLAENTPENALVLASPSMGLFIPAYTGRRVIYGHPFETISAVNRRTQAERMLTGVDRIEDQATCEAFDFVFWGPRELALSQKYPDLAGEVAYSSGKVTLYYADPSGCEQNDGT